MGQVSHTHGESSSVLWYLDHSPTITAVQANMVCFSETVKLLLEGACSFTAPDSTEASEVGEQKAAGEVGPQLRRRRSLLAALEQIGRAEEEEEKEEEFQLPRQQEDSGFSVNKCILAALILLGLGTIFFSGKYHLQFTG